MNRRQQAVLFHRSYPKKDGKISRWYWYYVYDEYGRRKSYSLRTQSKTHARRLLDELIASGDIIPPTGDSLPLSAFAEPFWQSDRCLYVRSKRLRGERITAKTIKQNRGYLDNHILPALGEVPLGALTPAKIDAFLLSLKEDKELSNKSINNVLSCLRVITSEAVRAGHTQIDLGKGIKPLHNNGEKRGILTFEEAQELFAHRERWRNPVVFTINLSAATTGARLGELRALKGRNIRQHKIVIDGVQREGEGYVEHDTKTGPSGLRIITLPLVTDSAIRNLVGENKKAEAFVFSLDGGRNPIGANVATLALHDALRQCKMADAEQLRRGITFHSWRHFFNSIMRGRVPDTDLRHVIGHTTAAMTERYSHRMPEKIEQFAEAQEEAFALISQSRTLSRGCGTAS